MVADAAARKTRVALVSPMPPQDSGIADYVGDLLDGLSRAVDLEVFATNDDPDPAPCPVHRLSELGRGDLAASYEVVITQVANDVRLASALSCVNRRNGVTVLHDLNLSDLFGGIYFPVGNVKGFFREILRQEGAAGFCKAVWRFALTRKCPTRADFGMIRGVARRSRVVIVHSAAAAERIRRIARAVVVAPVPMTVQPAADSGMKAKLRDRLSIPRDALVVASFGGVQERKRIHIVMESLARLMPRFPNLRYLLVGSYDSSWERRAAELGLGKIVRFVGRVDELAVFYDYIAACDLCVNLRSPWIGETSGPLLRVMSAGRPVIVTDVGSFAELPDSVCLKVSPEERLEGAQLYEALEFALGSEDWRMNAGARAREFVAARHSVDRAVSSYMEAVRLARDGG